MNNLTLSNKITFKAALKWAFVVALAFGVFLPMRSDANAGETTTWDCGGEGETPCSASTEFFWANGNLFADRGLKATGFRVLPDIGLQLGDMVRLNREDLELGRRLAEVDIPTLRARVQGLTISDFLADVDNSGTARPGPDFRKPGWSVVADFKNLMADLRQVVGSLPHAIRKTAGPLPEQAFAGSNAYSAEFDVSKFRSDLEDLKGFLTARAGPLGWFEDLILDFYDPPGTSVNSTRRQQEVEDFQGAWTYWALVNQLELAKDEPLNWVTLISTHNSFNNRSDGYAVPNDWYSMTDQLRLGARSLLLDLHWFKDQLRLCHGTSDHIGCAGFDRFYTNGIKEIGEWLDANPGEVIFVVIEDRSNGHDNYVNDPIAKYFGDRVFKPGDVATLGLPDPRTQRWPTIHEMRDKSEQVIIISPDDHSGEWIWHDTFTNPFTSSKADNFEHDGSRNDCWGNDSSGP